MDIFLTILTILILAIAYLTLSPISIYASYDVGEKRIKGAAVRLFPFHYHFKTGKKKEKPASKIKMAKPEKKVSPKKRKYSALPVLIDELETLVEVIVCVFRLLGGILKSPDRYYVRISLGGGLGAPDLTGQLFGGIESLKPVLGRVVKISYQPDFLAESIEGDVTAGLDVRIFSILKELLIFGLRLPKLRLIKIYRKMRKRG